MDEKTNGRMMHMFEKLFNRWKRSIRRTLNSISEDSYYVHGSGLIQIPKWRLNEIPKVIQEFHDFEAARMRRTEFSRR